MKNNLSCIHFKTQKMKKLLFILLCSGTTLAYAQDAQNDDHSIKDSHHNIIGYIMGGTITSASNQFKGQFKVENAMTSVLNKDKQVIGYLMQGHELQDANHKLLGNINSDGEHTYSYTITNAQNQAIGYVKADGTIQDANRNVIGYEKNTEVMWAAPYFFFFKSDFQ
jgi:hypothetical protein